MSRLNTFVSRPLDLNCCFWDTLLRLAEEPAFEFLREALSAPPGESEEASSEPSLTEDSDSEGDLGAAAPRAKIRKVERLPHAEEAAGLADLPDDGEWATGNQAPAGCSPHPVGRWSIQALRLLERAGHPRIWSVYNRGLLLFLAYRATYRLPSVWPIPGLQIRGFLLSLHSKGVSVDKILSYLSGLSYLSQMFRFQDPLEDFFTSQMITGLQWQQKPPIPLSLETLESLLGVLESVCDDFYECLMFQALFLLAFYVALRPKEMVGKTCLTYHLELLCLDNIEMEEDRVGIHLAVPKISPGRITYWLRSSEQPWLCPVLALKNYLAVRPQCGGPLFLYSSSHLLCKQRFLEVFHGALSRLDLPAQQYRVSSFWLGSITHAVSYNYPNRFIHYLARWPCRSLPGSPGLKMSNF